MDENAHELRFTSYLDSHPFLNVNFVRPYYLPLTDKLEVVEKLTTIYKKLYWIELVQVNQIIDTIKKKSTP